MLAVLFLHLAFDEWKLIVKRMNVAVDLHNNNKSKKGKLCYIIFFYNLYYCTNPISLFFRVRLFSVEEFLIRFRLMIGTSEFGRRGKQFWTESSRHNQGEEAEV